MKYSLTQGGILVAVAGVLVAQLGFSESCTTELTQKLLPVLGMLPGVFTAWYGRFRGGGVTVAGFKK